MLNNTSSIQQKILVLITLILCVFVMTPAATAANEFTLQRFYDPFITNGQLSAQLVVGDQASNVAAALPISLVLQSRISQGSVSAKAHSDYSSGDAIIITSGDIEPEFESIFEECGISADEYKSLATRCHASKEYLIIYGETDDDVMQVARDLAGAKIATEKYSVTRAPEGSTSLAALLEQKTSTQEPSEDDNQQDVNENDANNDQQVDVADKEVNNDADVQEIVNTSDVVQQEKKGFVAKTLSWLVGLFS